MKHVVFWNNTCFFFTKSSLKQWVYFVWIIFSHLKTCQNFRKCSCLWPFSKFSKISSICRFLNLIFEQKSKKTKNNIQRSLTLNRILFCKNLPRRTVQNNWVFRAGAFALALAIKFWWFYEGIEQNTYRFSWTVFLLSWGCTKQNQKKSSCLGYKRPTPRRKIFS